LFGEEISAERFCGDDDGDDCNYREDRADDVDAKRSALPDKHRDSGSRRGYRDVGKSIEVAILLKDLLSGRE
jgi:hypothetical protein